LRDFWIVRCGKRSDWRQQPPAGGKSDALKTYRPAETACNVG
jgi:hypothetical protein